MSNVINNTPMYGWPPFTPPNPYVTRPPAGRSDGYFFNKMLQACEKEELLTGKIEPICNIDLLHARIYTKLCEVVNDRTLTDYYCFNCAFVVSKCINDKYAKGRFVKGGAYVHLTPAKNVVITTPKITIEVSKTNVTVSGVSLNTEIATDVITDGLVPILSFIQSLAEADE